MENLRPDVFVSITKLGAAKITTTIDNPAMLYRESIYILYSQHILCVYVGFLSHNIRKYSERFLPTTRVCDYTNLCCICCAFNFAHINLRFYFRFTPYSARTHLQSLTKHYFICKNCAMQVLGASDYGRGVRENCFFGVIILVAVLLGFCWRIKPLPRITHSHTSFVHHI